MDWSVCLKQIGNQEYVFKGWDWCEVAEYFSSRTDLTEDECVVIIDKATDDVFHDIHDDDNNISCHPDVKKLKEFVRMVNLGDQGYTKPLWQGLYKIEHDSVFIQYFRILYKHLWT